MSMHLDVTYTPYATSSRGGTGDIITFTQFEKGGLLSESCDDAESGDKSDDDSTMLPLISEEEMDMMDSVVDSDDEYMSTEMLEDICEGIQFNPSVNRREARYRIRDHIKQRNLEWKGALNATQKMGKYLHKCLRL